MSRAKTGDKRVRQWGALSRSVTAHIHEVEGRLVKLGVPEKEAERWADKCWRLYAAVLIKKEK